MEMTWVYLERCLFVVDLQVCDRFSAMRKSQFGGVLNRDDDLYED